MKRIELSTSSLPRKCSTPELQRLVKSRDLPYTSRSGRRGSNPRPTAWKAVALPTELLPLIQPPYLWSGKLSPPSLSVRQPASAQAEDPGLYPARRKPMRDFKLVGKDGFEPPNSEEDRFTVCCRWPLGYLPIYSRGPQPHGAREGTRTPDQLITNQLLYQLSYSGW